MQKQKKQANDTVSAVSLFSMGDITDHLHGKTKETSPSDGRVSGRKTRNAVPQPDRTDRSVKEDTLVSVVGRRQTSKDTHDITTNNVIDTANEKSNKGTGTGRPKVRKTGVGSKVADGKSCEVHSGEQEIKGDTPEIHGTSRKRRHKFVTTSSIPHKMTFVGKPRPVKDDFSLVDIEIGDEIFRVSKWSIRDGIYCPGYDSNFLVKFYSTKK